MFTVHALFLFLFQASDMLRTQLLIEKGGAYLDTDAISKGPFPNEKDDFILEGIYDRGRSSDSYF